MKMVNAKAAIPIENSRQQPEGQGPHRATVQFRRLREAFGSGGLHCFLYIGQRVPREILGHLSSKLGAERLMIMLA
jgi:hypothetical protein